MLQLLQHQKTGEIIIDDIPAPKCFPNGILVETNYSVISAGTEKTSVDNAKASLIERAKRQPDQVKIVLDFIKKEGIFSTWARVKSKLDSYKTLGYSASGRVIETDCSDFQVGDYVAIAGAGYANHGEICSVPKNLAVKISEQVSLQDAAYTTIAAIALQGVRQAKVKIGENIAVIGLGLIGQITVQLLKANGANVVGFDIDESTFQLANEFGCSYVFPSNKDFVKEAIFNTNSAGFDSVLVTASANSNQPVELAIELLRKRGKIIIVGAVPMIIPRDNFYRKELELKIATSYGPGRYDPFYEELGEDYPIGFVRWTENRNMQSILNLLAKNQLNFQKLTTHQFPLQEANKAYQLISGEVKEKYLGIVLSYSARDNKNIKSIELKKEGKPKSKINIGFIGTGTFAQNYLLPALQKCDVEFHSIANSTPLTSLNVGKRFNFKVATNNTQEIISNNEIDIVFCATRHNSHAYYVMEAIKHNKTIFIEKPLAISLDELEKIDELYKIHQTPFIVGFNRRFSEPFLKINDFINNRSEPLNMLYRINAGAIPKNHWVQQPENGGRIIGEVCHFIDTMTFLAKSLPVQVYAYNTSTSQKEFAANDNIGILLKFRDGSIGNIIYTSEGAQSLPKEYFEVHTSSKSAIMDNFTKVKLFQGGKLQENSFNGEKGIQNEVKQIIQSIKNRLPMPINYNEIFAVSKATILAIDSIKFGKPLDL